MPREIRTRSWDRVVELREQGYVVVDKIRDKPDFDMTLAANIYRENDTIYVLREPEPDSNPFI